MKPIKEAWELHKLSTQKVAPLLTVLEQNKAEFHFSDGCGAGINIMLNFIMNTFEEGLSKKDLFAFIEKLALEGAKITQQIVKELENESSNSRKKV